MGAYTNVVMVADTTYVAEYMGASVSVAYTTAMQDRVGVQAEAYICNLVKYDCVTNWATLNAIYKLIMTEYVARSIAVAGIMYDTTGYLNTLIEAEDMVTVHLYRLQQIEEILKKADIQDFQGA